MWLIATACLFACPSLAAVNCTVTATTMAFGTYNPLSAGAISTTSTVVMACTLIGNSAERVNIVTSYSAGSSGTFTTRTMRSGSNTLDYNLFFDSAHIQVAGDGTGGSQTRSASFRLNNGHRSDSTTTTIYGRTPPLQDVAAGTYSDAITVTITY